MSAPNLSHPPLPFSASTPAAPNYATGHGNFTQPPPVYNNPAPPPVPGSGLPPASAPPPVYYNPAPPFTPAPPAPATKSRKRKSDVSPDNTKEDLFPSDVPEINSEDERLESLGSDTCNTIRRKIRTWIESGAQKVGEFQKTIGVSSRSYNSFMNRTGTWDGEQTDTFVKAHHFFKRRELQGLPLKANKPKKPKTAAASKVIDKLLNVSSVDPLPGEAQGTVAVYDTCNEIRKKIRALLAKEGMTQAAFIRALNKNLPEDGQNVSPANLRYFMGCKDVRGGNTNIAFYAAYIFFEKRCIQDGKPKSKFREEMEKAWGSKGFDTEHGGNQQYTCFAGERPVIDKYGKIDFVDARAFR
ncbi:hypothetical protein FGSG_00956 [Fusarium graminearum PH-1]|uniref:Chromosome 1, complete genome n=1 Tax=Gibberella zeae (strain ATCC MYA-4620 / CBS 123657 / FGSC 9075 / NRRL 31084 / PH-1) TaxID=229533 RepID=I1RBM6_GIBZE|nr:hypothetical protein FGSG_00956 [Fusarium graminearum PH-1]ESU06213.1 hypothetical protein FGSG_00956 [Fusarium graminearum PH-1]CEF73005.1 unnamed protein product [Fusarium graminearum]|eukprot:XP_011316698.1 hypothetical protein FGSG_00956 [Fusarium graminearum PH-1]